MKKPKPSRAVKYQDSEQYEGEIVDLREEIAALKANCNEAAKKIAGLEAAFDKPARRYLEMKERAEKVEARLAEAVKALELADHALASSGFQDVQPVRATVLAALAKLQSHDTKIGVDNNFMLHVGDASAKTEGESDGR